ncbi:ester cyclase [Haloarcula nitratireducens]|uniref:Ester cyclase n=1 Tax=Haloarcula nitratireducens TaxID=2487749 RepID=A0AAW4PJW1_9EURY|nr:ester cyclase [Halomicroarcula nitratireducens]MBX0298027.1 ester cyclase [Halomicroarcula nitratireducens]
MAQATSKAEQYMTEWVDIWNTGAYERLGDILDESATVYDPGAPDGVLEGRDEFEAHLRELRTGFPDFTIRIEAMLSEDEVVMTEWRVTATHDGEFNGIPATNREIELRGMSKTVIRDDEIVEDRVYHDFHAFLEQLGLTGE